MKKLLLLFFLFSFENVYLQQSINASGGMAIGAGGSANYSVGQMVFSSYSGASGTINEGVQQPYEIFLLSSTNFDLENTITLYPNPVANQLFLKVPNLNDKLHYKLVNVEGKMVLSDTISQLNSVLHLESFPGGIYFLSISSEDNSKHKTYKIIKK